MSDLSKDIFGNEDCVKGIEFNGKGKHYGKCPCDKEKCPIGYFNSFETIYDDKNPLDISVMKSGYYGKTCGEIAGKYPEEMGWNQNVFDKCKNFQQLHQGINNNLRQLKPLSSFTNELTNESFYNEPFYTPREETYKRAKSFNDQLHQKVNNSSSFLDRQTQSTSDIRRANNNWESVVGQMHEKDNRISNEIQLKTRLAEINNEDARQKNSTIMVILGSSVAFFIFILAIVGYQAGKISTRGMISLFVIAVIVFFIIAIMWNTHIMKKFGRFSDKLEKEIIHKGDAMNLQALEWVDENCNCEDVAKRKQYRANDNESMYYDGTTKLRLSPSGFERNSGYTGYTGYQTCKSHDNDNLQELESVRHKLNEVINNF